VVTEVFSHDYTAVEGQTLVIDVPVLARIATAAPAISAPAPGLVAPDDSRRHTRRVVALALGGVAVGLAAGGTVFGVRARSQYADARRVCGGVIDDCMADQVGASQQLVDRARSSGNVSSVVFGVAGATAVAAVVVWLTAPGLEARSIVIAPTAGGGALGLAVGGRF
jgi:hypothetical protein